MEHLSPELRQKVIKMSEARLRQKLLQAGYREVDVAKLDRVALLEYYAKVLLTETAYVPAKEEHEEGGVAGDSDGEEVTEFVESDAGEQNVAGGEKLVEKKFITYEDMWNDMLERYLYGPLRRRIQQRRQSELEERSGDRSLFVPVPKPRTGIESGIGKRETQPGVVVPERLSTKTASQYTDSQGQRPVPAPRPVPRRCYLCNSPTHLASDCPQKSSYRGYTPKPVPRPQVNFCKTKQKVDQPKQSKDGSCVLRDRSTGGSAEPTCSNCKPVSGSGVHSENSCQSSAASAVLKQY